jgi:hypothetical protein
MVPGVFGDKHTKINQIDHCCSMYFNSLPSDLTDNFNLLTTAELTTADFKRRLKTVLFSYY